MFSELCGAYRFDGRNTARLLATFFHERFEMKPGYDKAVEQFMTDDHDAANARLVIEENCLRLMSDEGEDVFTIERAWREGERRYIQISWYGRPERFEVQRIAERNLRLVNETNQLSQYVWERE